jgi:histidine triad (HIT) family protein
MSRDNCIFCKIVAGELEADRVTDDDELVAIRDINPQAPVHLLVIPKEHIESAAELTPGEDGLWGRMLHLAQSLAQDEGIDEAGYRLVVNIGDNGGQAVDHLHLHLLGGRQMTWPPG